MRKLISLLILLGFSLICRAQDMLSHAASSMGISPAAVHASLLKQQVTNSVVYIVYILVLIIISVIGWVKLRNDLVSQQSAKDPDDLVPQLIIEGVIASIFTVMALIYIPMKLTDIVMGFTNPEYGVVKELLNLIK